MISRSVLVSPGFSKHCLGEQAEYYAGEPVPSGWFGKGAEAMGLSGPVDAEQFDRLLAGVVRERDDDGNWQERVLQGKFDKASGEWVRKSGFDFTIEAPKSVSMQALVHGDDGALEAHRAAAVEAMRMFEAECRAHVRGEDVSAAMIAAHFEHIASRSGQEHLHTHFCIINACDVDGKVYSLREREIFRVRRLADAVYHNTLGNELRARGFAVQHDRNGHVEIEGYSRETIEARSGRRQQIKDLVEKAGRTMDTASAVERDAARAATAGKKFVRENAREEMQAQWQAEHVERGSERAVRTDEIAAEAKAEDRAARAREAVAAAIEHLTEREMVNDARKLATESLKFATDKTGFAEIKVEIQRLRDSGELIVGRPPRDDGKPGGIEIFTTRALIDLERSNQARIEAGNGQHEAVMSGDEFAQALAKFETRKGLELDKPEFALSDEQRAASRMILVGDDRFQAVQGLAGTGKTTMLEFVRDAAESKRWAVRGHTNGSDQGLKMQEESGIETTTTAAHLIEAKRQIRDEGGRPADAPPVRELRIMDEASMAGTKSFRDVLDTTERQGARTVFLGDKRQHQAVEAGRAFEQAQDKAKVATLGEASIRRQKTDQLRAAVSAILAGKHSDAIATLSDKIIEARAEQAKSKGDRHSQRDARAEDNKRLIATIGRDYAALTPAERSKIMVITATNEDRRAINAAIRAELAANGTLGETSREHVTLRGADITAAQARRAQHYEAGWVVETANRTKDWAKGTRLEVVRVDSRLNHLIVRDDAGKESRLDPGRIKVLPYTQARAAFAEGERIRFTQNHALDGVRVRNGQQATVAAIDERGTHLVVGEGERAQRITVSPGSAVKVDYAYTTTSHGAQGQSRNPWIHHNPDGGRHGQRATYVNITRSVDDLRVYTVNRDLLEKTAGDRQNKTAALDLAKPGISPAAQKTIDGIREARERHEAQVAAAAQKKEVPAKTPRTVDLERD